MIRLGWLGTYVQTSHDDHDDVVGRGEIDIVHDQELLVSEARIAVDVGLGHRFAAGLVLPVRIVSTSIRYLDAAGTEVELSNPGIHHRNETVSGIADPMLLGSISGSVRNWRLTARAGLTIPIGRTEPDPFVLGDMNMAHEHIQLGSGTVNPVLAVEAGRSWDKWRLGVFAFTQQVVYANDKGYQAGDRYAGGVTVRRALGTRWSVRGGVEVQGETAERWGGTIHTDDGNRGRFDLMLAAGAAWSATDSLGVDLGIKVPVVTHVVGGQLDMPAIVEVGASWTFGKPRPAPHVHDHDEHEHAGGEHDDHHDGHDGHQGHDDHAGHDDHTTEPTEPYVPPDITGLDVTDVTEPAPVAGKLTIIDYWATWCAPCKVLEPALVALARAHPDTVAIRRIDLSKTTSTLVLPHVVVFAANGTLALEKSSEPGKLDELIAAVAALVEPPVAPPQVAPAPAPTPTPAPKPAVKKPRRIAIKATDRAFEPAAITVRRNEPVVLVFERVVEDSCATEVIFEADGVTFDPKLPFGTRVDIRHTFKTPGTITFRCAMDMFRGTITVK